MAKVIKLTDNSNVTLLPITDARYVQMSYNGVTQSVADTILDNEEVTAAALNDLNVRITSIESTPPSSYTLSASNQASPANTVSYIELTGGSKIGIQGAGGLTVSYTANKNIIITHPNNHAAGSDIQKIYGDYNSSTNTSYVVLNGNGGEVGFYDTGSGSGKAKITFSYTSGKGIGMTVSYSDTNTDTKVAFASTTTNANYPLIFKYTATTATTANSVRFDSEIGAAYYNPSLNYLYTVTAYHNAMWGSVGSGTYMPVPVYDVVNNNMTNLSLF